MISTPQTLGPILSILRHLMTADLSQAGWQVSTDYWQKDRADMSVTPFMNRIANVASSLADGCVGGTYIEASLLLSAAISGIATALWPGLSGDRRRFVEAWATFADIGLSPVRISQPLLRQALASSGRSQGAIAIARTRPAFPSHRVVTAEEIDLDETDVQSACPSLQLREIRKYSYPVIFYEHVRSSLVHEYEIGASATIWPMAHGGRTVSYENYCSTRKIHFHASWLIELAKSIAVSVDRQHASLPIAPASSWWIDG